MDIDIQEELVIDHADHVYANPNPESNDIEMENETINQEPLLSDSRESNDTPQMNELLSKCRSLQVDAQISGEILESALQEEYIGGIQNELDDLKKYEKEYNEAYVEITAKYPHLINRQEIDDAKRKFVIFVKRYKAKAIAALRPTNSLALPSNSQSSIASRLKLQKIDIPCFTGKEKEKWMPWKRLFETYIHQDKDLTPLEKHRYLSTKIIDEAASLIDKIPLDGAHYEAAYKIIVDHYDDPLERVAKHLDALFVTQLSPSGKNLRKLVTYFRAQVTALQVTFEQNPDIDVFSQFCIHAFLLRANASTLLDWEREMEKRKTFVKLNECYCCVRSEQTEDTKLSPRSPISFTKFHCSREIPGLLGTLK